MQQVTLRRLAFSGLFSSALALFTGPLQTIAYAEPCTVVRAPCITTSCTPTVGSMYFTASCSGGPAGYFAIAELKEVAVTSGTNPAPAAGQAPDGVNFFRVQCFVNGEPIYALGCSDTFVSANIGDNCNDLRSSGGTFATSRACGQDGPID